MSSEMFTAQLDQLNDVNIKKFVGEVLKAVPAEFFVIPAAKSGKYHHPDSQGVGGLVRHVHRACYFTGILLASHDIKSDDIKGDIVLASVILHDIGKRENYANYWEYYNHPLVATEMIKPYKGLLPEKLFGVISNCIKYHMGPWTPKSHKKPMEKYNILELMVYYSDFFSARKDVDIAER